jgi:hypothetical protein
LTSLRIGRHSAQEFCRRDAAVFNSGYPLLLVVVVIVLAFVVVVVIIVVIVIVIFEEEEDDVDPVPSLPSCRRQPTSTAHMLIPCPRCHLVMDDPHQQPTGRSRALVAIPSLTTTHIRRTVNDGVVFVVVIVVVLLLHQRPRGVSLLQSLSRRRRRRRRRRRWRR